MKAILELENKKVNNLRKFIEENGVKCTLKISTITKGKSMCIVNADEANWNRIKPQLVRNQLMFDYYEDNQYIAAPFKEIRKGD